PLGEGHGDQAWQRRLAAAEERENAAHQLRRFAGAGGGFDDERGVEIAANAVARLGVDQLAQHRRGRALQEGAVVHTRFLSLASGTSRSCFFLLARSSS